MKNVFVLGSINMDMVITTPYMPRQGETLMGKDFFLNSGGKGANQAVACAKQEIKTYLIANVGNDVFGHDLLNVLSQYNVDCSYIDTLDNTSTGVAMIIVENHDNRIILDSGANAKISTSQIDNALNCANKGDIFVTQLENNLDAILYGIEKAKEKELITIFNPAPAIKLDMSIYKYVDYLIVNETECEILSGLYPGDESKMKEAYEKIGCENLIITLGSKGSVLINKGGMLHVSPNKVEAIDTTAAGDTYVGVLASCLSLGKSAFDSLSYASIVSSLTCTKKGAQKSIPTKKEVLEYLHK